MIVAEDGLLGGERTKVIRRRIQRAFGSRSQSGPSEASQARKTSTLFQNLVLILSSLHNVVDH